MVFPKNSSSQFPCPVPDQLQGLDNIQPLVPCLEKVNQKMMSQNRYILLFIENCFAHPHFTGVTSSWTISLPAPHTSFNPTILRSSRSQISAPEEAHKLRPTNDEKVLYSSLQRSPFRMLCSGSMLPGAGCCFHYAEVFPQVWVSRHHCMCLRTTPLPQLVHKMTLRLYMCTFPLI